MNQTNNKIEITREEYVRLLVEAETLSRLEAGGVDNWSWYGDSLNPDGEPSIEEFERQLEEKFFNHG